MDERKPLFPLAYFAIAIVLMLLLYFLVPTASRLNWPWRAAGAIPIVIGLGLNVVADSQFKHHHTTIKPFLPSTTLVTEGLFGLSRNPMFLGMAFVLVGIGIMFATFSPLAVIPAFIWWITIKFVVPEEQSLTAQFGQTFIEYRSRVRRWL